MVAMTNDQPDFNSDDFDEKSFAELNKQITSALMTVGLLAEKSPEEVYLCTLMQTHRVLNGLTKQNVHPERDDAKRQNLRKTLAALLNSFAADLQDMGE